MTNVAPQETSEAPVRWQSLDAPMAGMATTPPAENAQTIVREPKLDAQGRAYATGKRKNAVARVWIKPGKGQITINDRDQTDLFRPSRPADDDRPAAADR